MTRRALLGALALGAAAIGLSGCAAPSGTAELTVTFADGAEQTAVDVSFTDLSCTTSSSARTVSSAAKNPAGKELFFAMAPTDGRETYPISIWFDGRSFVSTAKFDASGSTITFDALPGLVEESPNGERATSAGVAATLDGTITCN